MTLFELLGVIAIDNTEAMTKINATVEAAKNLGEEMDEAGEDAEKLGSKLDEAGNNADTASGKLNENSKFGTGAVWLGNMLSTLTTKALQFGKMLYSQGIDYNAQIESYTASFTAFLGGSAEEAAAFVEEIRQFAVATPMEMSGLAKNALSLMQMGVKKEDIISTLQVLGDLTLGNQEMLNGVVYAYGQVIAQSKLAGQEAIQFANHGLPVWEILSDYLGQSVAEVKALSEGGKITSDILTEAFKHATKEGGKYYNQMETQMTTYNGQMAKLGDTADQTVGNLFSSLFEVLKSDILPKLNESLEAFGTWVNENPELLKSWAESIGTLATNGLDNLLGGLEWMIANKDATVTALKAIGAAFVVAFSAAHPYIAAFAAIGVPVFDAMIKYTEATNQLNSEEGKKATQAANDYAKQNGGHLFRTTDTSSFQRWLFGSDEGSKTKITLPDANATAEEIKAWFDELDPELKKELGLTMPGPDAMAKQIEAWWASVRPTLTATFDIKPSANLSDLQRQHLAVISGDDSWLDGSHASGLDYVPKDNYLARLHLGETVLNKEAAAAWRQQQKGGGTAHLEGVVAELASAIQDLREGIGMNLYVNKRHVASAMSRDMGKSIGNREYTLMKGMGG